LKHPTSPWAALLQLSAVAVTVVATLSALLALLREISLDILPGSNPGGDAFIYLTVGRAILSGLVPYVDIFETKPPGMFLIAAFSLLTSGDETLAIYLQISILGALAVLPILFVWLRWEVPKPSVRPLAILSTTAFFVSVALYATVVSGRFQTESFGAFFTVVYLLIVLWDIKRMSAIRTVLAAFALCAAVGLKEPFLLVAMLSALVLRQDRRFLWTFFFRPLLVAVAIGLAFLFIAGWLEPYFAVYLPEMVGNRITGEMTYWLPDGRPLLAEFPLWLRGFWIRRLFKPLLLAPHPFATGIAVSFILLFLLSAIRAFERTRHSWAERVVSLLLFVGGAYLLNDTYVLVQLHLIAGQPLPFDPYYIYRWGRFLCVVVAWAVSAVWLGRRNSRTLQSVAIHLLCLYGAASVVALGEYRVSHFGFLIPLYVAVFLQNSRQAFESRERTQLLACVVGLPVATAVVVAIASGEYQQFLARTREARIADARELVQDKMTAPKIDRVLDECGWERYQTWGATSQNFWAYTRHIPNNLYWDQWLYATKGTGSMLGRRVHRDILSSPVAVVSRDIDPPFRSEHVATLLERHFTQKVPPCVRHEPDAPGLTFYFRTPTGG